MAGLAVNTEPATEPPHPLRRFGGLFWKSVIHPNGATDYKEALSYFVNRSSQILAGATVNDEIADSLLLRRASFRPDLDSPPSSQQNRMLPGSSVTSCEDEQHRAKEGWAHGNELLL